MAGTLRSRYSPSASRVAAISLSAEFLAPPTATVPSRGRTGPYDDLVHDGPVLPLGAMGSAIVGRRPRGPAGAASWDGPAS